MSDTIEKFNVTGQPQWVVSLNQKEVSPLSSLEKLNNEIFDYLKNYQFFVKKNELTKQENAEPLQCLKTIEEAIEHGKNSGYSSWKKLFEINIDSKIPALANVQIALTDFSDKYKIFSKESQAHRISNGIVQSHQTSIERSLQELNNFFTNEEKMKLSLDQLKKAVDKMEKKYNWLDEPHRLLMKNLLHQIKKVEETGFPKKENITLETNLLPFWSAYNGLRYRCAQFELKKGAIDHVTEGIGEGTSKIVEGITGNETTDQLKQGATGVAKYLVGATLGKMATVVNFISPTPEDPIPKTRKKILQQGHFFATLLAEMGRGESLNCGVKKIINDRANTQKKLEEEVVRNKSLKDLSANSNTIATEAFKVLIIAVEKAKEALTPTIEQQLSFSQDFKDSCTQTTQLHQSGKRWNVFCGLTLLLLGATALVRSGALSQLFKKGITTHASWGQGIIDALQTIDKKILYTSTTAPFALAFFSRLVVLKQEHQAAEGGAHKLYLYGQKTFIHKTGGKAAEESEIVKWAAQEQEALQLPALVRTKLERLLINYDK
ncbi:MAG: hypothetical protein JSR80_00540 [Verrucomicrobia bacterium]|nr:hypothetical protein [Verrucomicrobiota bacterium]